MADRYFVESPIEGPAACLRGAEAHHLAHVMRARPGVEVTLFDGNGAEFLARVERVGRSEIELAIVACQAVDRETHVPITLAVARPKGDRQRWLVEKATELGVARFVPLHVERGNDRQSPAGLDRLRRSVIEASKQCGRNRLMAIAAAESLADFLTAPQGDALRLIAHPGAKSCRQVLDDVAPGGATPAQISLAIGPEGGFTAEEVDLALAHHFHAVSLGPRILRVETAALSLAAAVIVRYERT